MVDEAPIVETLLHVARPIILSEYRADSCIGSTRIAIDALDYFGVEAIGFGCRAMVWNRVHAAAVDAGHSEPTSVLGAHSVGIGYPNAAAETTPGLWLHVVALTAHQLIDLSLDQASRPERDMETAPLAGPRPAFKDGLHYSFACVDSGVRVLYERCDDPCVTELWHRSRNWQRNVENRRLTGQVIRAMRKRLE